MLNEQLREALQQYTRAMTEPVSLVLQTGEHSKREELLEFLEQVCSVSDLIEVKQADLTPVLRSPISFLIERSGVDTGIRFSGIPGGHEFNSLVLAILQAGGSEIKLDPAIEQVIRSIEEPLHFETVIGLSCHNCPDVVQALNQFALLNPKITAEMIDGALFQGFVEDKQVQGVPAVFANGDTFANGKVDAAGLVEKVLAMSSKVITIESEMPVQDISIIGGGPAGIAAAIYAARKGLNTTLIADRIGGQVLDTQDIENFISVSKTTGPQLSAELREHLMQYEVNLREQLRVRSVERAGPDYRLILASGEVITSKTVILATGARWRELGVPGERELSGSGVAYCPHCDGPFYKGKPVAVIGGGNSGVEAALDLAGIVESVVLLEFAPELKADHVLVERAKATDNISMITNAQTTGINEAHGKVSSLTWVDRASEQQHDLAVDGVFIQIGLVPNSQIAEGLVDINNYGEIIIDDRCKTSQPGVFAAGDVTTTPYKQIVTASGEGAKAALTAFEYLLTQYNQRSAQQTQAA